MESSINRRTSRGILSTILQECCKKTNFHRACLSLSYLEQKKSSLFKSDYFFRLFVVSIFFGIHDG